MGKVKAAVYSGTYAGGSSNRSGGGGSLWRDAAPSSMRRCPICHHGSWCQIGRGEAAGVVLCKRVPSSIERTNKESIRYWVHRDESLAISAQAYEDSISRYVDEMAPAAVRHAAYTALLGALPLEPWHRDNLLARGLSDEAIKRAFYASMPGSEGGARGRLATVIADAVGIDQAKAVPGYVMAPRGAWLAGAKGLLIPARDSEGRIVALKVRSDDGGPKRRYTSVSSQKYGGAKAEPAVHIPLGVIERVRSMGTIRITEGELKAEVISQLTTVGTISVPGVGNWARAIPLLVELGVKSVRIAYDRDADVTPEVFDARTRLISAIVKQKLRWTHDQWLEEEGNGLDDALAFRLRKKAS